MKKANCFLFFSVIMFNLIRVVDRTCYFSVFDSHVVKHMITHPYWPVDWPTALHRVKCSTDLTNKQARRQRQTSSCSSRIRSSSTTASSHCESSCRTRLNAHSASVYIYISSANVTFNCEYVTDIWNSLPPDVLHCNTLNTFKKHLKTHLFTSSLTLPHWPVTKRRWSSALRRYINVCIIIIIIIIIFQRRHYSVTKQHLWHHIQGTKITAVMKNSKI